MMTSDKTATRDDDAAQQALQQASAARASLTERQKMLRGEGYLAMSDPDLTRGRLRTRPLLQALNTLPWPKLPEDTSVLPDFYGPDRRKVLEELFGLQDGECERLGLEIEPPFYCDYGINIKFAGPFYCNFSCMILDCAQVTLGSRVLFAPDVHVYAATHPTDVAQRRAGIETAYPVTIGDDVWIGGGSRIIGPCTIGDGVTVAAGSVCKGVLEPYCVYAGVPARLIKRLEKPNEQISST